MSEVPISKLIGALVRKGFVRRETHHIMLWFAPAGRRSSIVTRISHGQRAANDWLLARIADQTHLSKRELLEFVECTIGADEYLQLMVERGHVT